MAQRRAALRAENTPSVDRNPAWTADERREEATASAASLIDDGSPAALPPLPLDPVVKAARWTAGLALVGTILTVVGSVAVAKISNEDPRPSCVSVAQEYLRLARADGARPEALEYLMNRDENAIACGLTPELLSDLQ